MTRKEALIQAISALQESTLNLPEKEEVISKLCELKEEMPNCMWSEKTIFDAFEQFIFEHGRVPSSTDLKSKKLPSHPTIENRFKMSAREFINKYYGDRTPFKQCNSNMYYNHPKEFWLENFKHQYVKLGKPSRDKYDKSREKHTPCIQTLLNISGFKNYSELLQYCGYTRSTRRIFKKEQQVSKVERNFKGSSQNLEDKIKMIRQSIEGIST